jgi:two-component system NtrC family response regulator
VVATNRDLDKMAEAGDFREDLLFRLRSLTIKLPPLRERPGDIEELVRHHIAELCRRYGTGAKSFAPDFLEALAFYEWPGNVRELFGTVERAMAAAREESILFAHHLPEHIRIGLAQGLLGKGKRTSAKKNMPPESAGAHRPALSPLKDVRSAVVNDAEEQYLKTLMSFTKGDIKKSCVISGLSRPRLYALLNKYKISRTD